MENKPKVTVLLIDDEDEVLKLLGEFIEANGFKCLKAPTGEIGLDVFKRNKPDVAIVDLKLPAMQGLEVLKQMKDLKSEVPVIILTGMGYDKKEVDKAKAAGADGYIAKAMPAEIVISKINDALRKKKQ